MEELNLSWLATAPLQKWGFYLAIVVPLGVLSLVHIYVHRLFESEEAAMSTREEMVTHPSGPLPIEQISDVTCPFCASDEIAGEFVETCENGAVKEMECLKCGRGWNNVYEFVEIYFESDEDNEYIRISETVPVRCEARL